MIKRIAGSGSQRFLIGLILLVLAVCGGCQGVQQGNPADENIGLGEDAGTKAPAFSDDTGEEESTDDLTVWFLDVGQGSAALVHQKDSWMLVDGGDQEASSYVVGFLKEKGVTKLDYVVVSHYDSDHLSGIVGVLHAIECSQVLAPDYEADTKIYESFQKICEEKKLAVSHPKMGEAFTFADSSFRIVSPASYEYEDGNSNSLGIRLEYEDSSFLICGDCTEESEQDLLYLGTDVKSDVFAANHHGSRYSNCPEFLEAVAPEAVVISCGKGNSYGHPDASVLLSVQNLGADLYRTDLQGEITAVSDGKEIVFEPDACMDYRSGPELREDGKEADGQDSGSDVKLFQEDVPPYYKEGTSADGGAEAADKEGTAADEGAEASNEVSAGQEPYILNTNTKKFHKQGCSSAEEIKEENLGYAADREELIDMGYTPCKRCEP